MSVSSSSLPCPLNSALLSNNNNNDNKSSFHRHPIKSQFADLGPDIREYGILEFPTGVFDKPLQSKQEEEECPVAVDKCEESKERDEEETSITTSTQEGESLSCDNNQQLTSFREELKKILPPLPPHRSQLIEEVRQQQQPTTSKRKKSSRKSNHINNAKINNSTTTKSSSCSSTPIKNTPSPVLDRFSLSPSSSEPLSALDTVVNLTETWLMHSLNGGTVTTSIHPPPMSLLTLGSTSALSPSTTPNQINNDIPNVSGGVLGGTSTFSCINQLFNGGNGGVGNLPITGLVDNSNLFVVNNHNSNHLNNGINIVNNNLSHASQQLPQNGPNTSLNNTLDIYTCQVTNGSPRAILSSFGTSHPFDDRTLEVGDEKERPIKVGRAVARLKPSPNNAIFDCKVLSRNHAQIFFKEGKFFLQDMGSSNGTFVNRQRLSENNNPSAPFPIYSGDVVQFGVDVVENQKRVTHGCVVATIRLFGPDGQEIFRPSLTRVHISGGGVGAGSFDQPAAITTYQLVQISQCLRDAMAREEALSKKIQLLESVLSQAVSSSEDGWKALVEEDRLLSRIESLQSRLETALTCLNSKNSEEEVVFLRNQVLHLHEEKDACENEAKEYIQREKSKTQDAQSLLCRLQLELRSTEEEVNRLSEVTEGWQKEFNTLSEKYDKQTEEFEELFMKHSSCEDNIRSLKEQLETLTQSMAEKLINSKHNEVMENGETSTNNLVNLEEDSQKPTEVDGILEGQGDSPIKKDNSTNSQQSPTSSSSSSDSSPEIKKNITSALMNSSTRELELQSLLSVTRKQLESALNDVDRLKRQLSEFEESGVAKKRKEGEDFMTTSSSLDATITENNEIVETEDSSDSDSIASVIEVDQLKDGNVLKAENARLKAKLIELGSCLRRSEDQVSQLQDTAKGYERQIELLMVNVNSSSQELMAVSSKLSEADAKMKFLEESVQKLKQEENRDRKPEIPHRIKKIASEEVDSKSTPELLQAKLDIHPSSELLNNDRSQEAVSLRKEVESLTRYTERLEKELQALKEKSSSTFKLPPSAIYVNASKLSQPESSTISRSMDDSTSVQSLLSLLSSRDQELLKKEKELESLRKNLIESLEEKEHLTESLATLKEDLEVVKYQSKITSTCAIIPLLMLVLAFLMAFYPTVSTVTGTAET